MGKKRGGTNAKCQRYLTNRTRIKNKTILLEKYIESKKDETAKENIRRSCRIGRKKEGFTPEEFKRRKKHVENSENNPRV
jgi:hypothetical protein